VRLAAPWDDRRRKPRITGTSSCLMARSSAIIGECIAYSTRSDNSHDNYRHCPTPPALQAGRRSISKSDRPATHRWRNFPVPCSAAPQCAQPGPACSITRRIRQSAELRAGDSHRPIHATCGIPAVPAPCWWQRSPLVHGSAHGAVIYRTCSPATGDTRV